MSEHIAGDGRTFAHHWLTANFKQIWHHDLPKAFGNDFDLAKYIQQKWETEEPELKDALLHASGIVEVIKNDLDAAPKDVIDKILSNFTNLKIEDLQNWLPKVTLVFTGIESSLDDNLETTIESLQDFFKAHDETKLGHIASVVMQTLAGIIAPGSVVAKIVLYAQAAYSFVKKWFEKK